MEEASGNGSSGRTSSDARVLRSLSDSPSTPSSRFSTSCTRARSRDQSTSSFSLADAYGSSAAISRTTRGDTRDARGVVTECCIRVSPPAITSPAPTGPGPPRVPGTCPPRSPARPAAVRPAPWPAGRSPRPGAPTSSPPPRPGWPRRGRTEARASRAQGREEEHGVHDDHDHAQQDELRVRDHLAQVALRAYRGQQQVEARVAQRGSLARLRPRGRLITLLAKPRMIGHRPRQVNPRTL